MKIKFTFLFLFIFYTINGISAQDAKVEVFSNWNISKIPDELYGWNSRVWFGFENGSNAGYNKLLENGGFKVLRWPGGSWGDIMKWDNTQCINSWVVNYANSKVLYNKYNITMQPIVNFSGFWCDVQHTQQEAVDLAKSWVQEGAVGARYWEIGNESMGSWEQGHTIGSDYGKRFADFYTGMKSVNNTIKILAVGDPNDKDDSFNNGTGVWTREVLKASLKKGVVPDGFQIHNYPGSGGNYDLLHTNLDEIDTYTKDLNYMVSHETGNPQSAYCMTEFGASGNDRWIKMIGAQFALQYIMEMARHNWKTANIFGEINDNTTFTAAPVWYVYAFLYGKFGRELVNSQSDNSDIRTYASKTTDQGMTLWVCNNSTDSKTVTIKMYDFKPTVTGEMWVMEGANNLGEESYDLSINGVKHPLETTAKTMPGIIISTGNTFQIALPKSSMTLIKLNSDSVSTCNPTAILPNIQLGSRSWSENTYTAVDLGTTVSLGPTADGLGSWSWTGPLGFTSSERVVTLSNLQKSGIYTVTFTNQCGAKSMKSFMVNAVDSNRCDQTSLTPYSQVNGGTWKTNKTDTIPKESSISFGPQPWGTWSWTGPNGFSSLNREISINNIQSSGNYVATFKNACGAKSTLTFRIIIKDIAGIEEIQSKNAFKIYPNPSNNGTFQLKTDASFNNIGIDVLSLQGKVLFQKVFQNKVPVIESNLPAGIYIIRINADQQRYYNKLLIK